MPDNNQFVILEWIPYDAEFPRYSFATLKHAEELGSQVHWLDTCRSIPIAAERVRQLNLPDAPDGTTTRNIGRLLNEGDRPRQSAGAVAA